MPAQRYHMQLRAGQARDLLHCAMLLECAYASYAYQVQLQMVLKSLLCRRVALFYCLLLLLRNCNGFILQDP
jgi:hypothetical protein